MDNRTLIGLRVRAARMEAGKHHSQAKTAEMLGIGKTRWNQWERGIYFPDVDAMVRFSESYDVPMDWIYKGRLPGVNPERSLRITRLFEREKAKRAQEPTRGRNAS